MEDFLLSYREVIPDQTNPQIWKEITLNTGAIQSTLQDIKVAEKAGGYYYSDLSKVHVRNRFIYWRTNRDVLELSEISLDLNLIDNNVRYKFSDSPVLAVSIFEVGSNVIVLVATVSSVHYLKFNHPNRMHKSNDETQAYSIFYESSTNKTGRDSSSLFYVIGHAAMPNYPIPHTATCWIHEGGKEAYFAFAYQNNLMLFTMNCTNGNTTMVELKENHIVPRIFSNITGALRGKTATLDSQYATSLVFTNIDDTIYLYGLYRDDHIRMWSTKTNQCVGIVNCLPNSQEIRVPGSQNSSLRRASSNTICAFLCYASGSEFTTIRSVSDGPTTFTLQKVDVIPAPEFDLVDFDVNENRIWGLWCNSQGEYNASSFSLIPNNSSSWVSAGLEILPDRYVKVEEGLDPRQAYCSYIFHPGRFQRDVIDKALVMFRRSNMLSDPNVSMAVLKDRVCYAIEQEVQNELKDFDATDDLYIETSFKYWERFYSCCEQYHVKACQPIGIVILESMGSVSLIKKNAFSLLRPCELLEHLMLVGENVESHQLNEMMLSEEIKENEIEDLVKLIAVLSVLEQQISDEDKMDIDTKLYELNIPNVVVSELVADMISRDYEQNTLPRDFLLNVNEQVKLISQLPNAMILLLKMLRMDEGQPEAMHTYAEVSQTSRMLLNIGHLFRSSTGISVLAESLRQISIIRYSLCRNLLILQHILMDSSDFQRDTIEIIRSRCMPETVVFLQAYYVMVWICETSEVSPSAAALEASIQRLGVLQLSDARYKLRSTQSTSVLELFLRGRGSQTALSLLVEGPYRNFDDPQWQYTLLPLANIVGQLIWAVSGNFLFGEWLIGSCQHILIQEYVRLLNSWCEWNKCSRHFIAAVSLLDNGESHKAFDLFMQSVKGVLTEPFLEKIILQSATNVSQNEAIVQYYLKVIQLFEQHSVLDCVIRLAKVAIDVLEPENPQLAMFQSIVFTNHLHLEHFTEAYHSLISNAEFSRRKDCLRQLVVCLFEKQRLDLLMKFPYLGLQDELETIIESRARSMAIEGNNYYDFLHAFHVSKSNMRKAAMIMYEQALRCLLECETLAAVERRYECLLTCLTALNLTDKDYAWIARPVINDDIDATDEDSDKMEVDEIEPKRQVAVLELSDIRKELIMTEAIITLAKHRKELSSILNADIDELIAVLASLGLYTAAIKLAKESDKNISNVLQSLAFACVRATDENANECWSWLQENDLADLPQKNSASHMAWSLLLHLIQENEEPGSTVLHKAVANKILSLGEFMPHGLFLSYRRLNTPQLLYLYVQHGRLIEATDLTKEYIAAMQNTGGEYFGLKNALHATLPALCLPINTIDLLLYNLKLNAKEDEEYVDCLKDLEKDVHGYLKAVDQNSRDKIEYLQSA